MAEAASEAGQPSAPHTACSAVACVLPGRSATPALGVALPDPCVAQGLHSGRAFIPQRAKTRARWSNPKSWVDHRLTAPFAGPGILVGPFRRSHQVSQARDSGAFSTWST